jgi:nucleolar protein 9
MDRSRKSAKWAARQGPLKSVFAQFSDTLSTKTKAVPGDFGQMAIRFVQLLRKELSVNETKAFVIDGAASPVVQVTPPPP